MASSAEAFRLVVIEMQLLRDTAEALDVSHVTVARDVASYKTSLADQRGKETLEERRAAFVASLDDVYGKALEAFAYYMRNRDKGRNKMLLAATAALNCITALQARYRAVGVASGIVP